MQRALFPVLVIVLSVAVGCKTTEPKESPEAVQPQAVSPAAVQSAPTPAAPTPSPARAELGAPAPDFTLPDLDGHSVTLSSFRGKVVVLEWFNPECPFVNLSHTKGSLVDTAARHMAEGVVWLGVNSAGPGREGHDLDANRDAVKRFQLKNPVLLDEDGHVGKAYGAAHTPHLFIVDAGGKLVYRGAPDNSPDAEKGSPQGGALVNYVDAALADLAASKPVQVAETEAYGCSVKYAQR